MFFERSGFTLKLIKTCISPRGGKKREKFEAWKKKLKKKSFGFGKKDFGSNTYTEIGPWFWFPIPKPGFGCTLVVNTIFSLESKRIKSKMRTFAT